MMVYVPASALSLSLSLTGVYLVQFINYNVAALPVSFHIPLHRILAGYLHSGALGSLKAPITSLLQLDRRDPTWVVKLIEHPLRVQVLGSQILANLWVRNGTTMLRQVPPPRIHPFIHSSIYSFMLTAWLS